MQFEFVVCGVAYLHTSHYKLTLHTYKKHFLIIQFEFVECSEAYLQTTTHNLKLHTNKKIFAEKSQSLDLSIRILLAFGAIRGFMKGCI